MLIRSHAPTRLGLAGGGTDVPPYSDTFGGRVLNATIDIYAHCHLEPTERGAVELNALDLSQSFETSASESLTDCPAAFRLHQAVINHVLKTTGRPRLSFKLTTFSEAPPGSGLGSSSTMVVAILNAFVDWLGIPYGEYDLARAAYQIERVDLALLGGKQDHYSAAFGGVNLMEFEANDKVIVNPLRLKANTLRELEASIFLVYTGLSRDSSKIIEEQSSNVTKGNSQSIDAMHELKLAAQLMKEALLLGDIPRLAGILRDSWESKKQTAKSISNSLIEEAFDIALTNGASAGKVSGAGGGGYVMFLADPAKRPHVKAALEAAGRIVTLPRFMPDGATTWRSNNGIIY